MLFDVHKKEHLAHAHSHEGEGGRGGKAYPGNAYLRILSIDALACVGRPLQIEGMLAHVEFIFK